MLYRFLRGFNEIYPVTVLFAFIAAFFVAFAFTVIYPLVPIILIISSVFLVVIARVVYLTTRRIELGVALGALKSGRCPACATTCDVLRVGEARVQECPGCRRIYDETGAPYVPRERTEDAEKPVNLERSSEDAVPEAGGA
jgi:hypothetical protein